MRVLIFSDIHGNLPAFERMLAKEKGIDLYVSLGDVVNYGPWSNECVELLSTLPAIRLMGNHEEYFINGSYPGQNTIAKAFFGFCSKSFTERDTVSRYEKSFEISGFRCVHTINDQYLYPDSEIKALGNYFIGHSHHQFDRKGEGYHVINVGSVGQDRKEINVSNYVVFNTDLHDIELKSFTYDIDSVINRMIELDYPQECIAYYSSKSRRIT